MPPTTLFARVSTSIEEGVVCPVYLAIKTKRGDHIRSADSYDEACEEIGALDEQRYFDPE